MLGTIPRKPRTKQRAHGKTIIWVPDGEGLTSPPCVPSVYYEVAGMTGRPASPIGGLWGVHPAFGGESETGIVEFQAVTRAKVSGTVYAVNLGRAWGRDVAGGVGSLEK